MITKDMSSQPTNISRHPATSNGMKLLYIANIRLPTEKAHGIQIMETVSAISQINIGGVSLLVPRRFNEIKKNPFEYYGIVESFPIVRLPVIDLLTLHFLKPFWFLVGSITFAVSIIVYTAFQKTDIVYYTRDLITAFFFSVFGKPIFYELHTISERWQFLHLFVWRKSNGLVVISNGIKKELVCLGISEKKIALAPDAVDLSYFNVAIPREEARKKLNLPIDKKIVLYTGHLYKWKGVDTLIEAAKNSDKNTLVYFVGGTNEDISKFKIQNSKFANVVFIGHRPHHEIPLWLRAADILVLPTSGKAKIGMEYTSPMKLFEYMASGTPIIASDVSSTREIVSEKDVSFFIPDDSLDLALQIRHGVNNYDRLIKQAESASVKGATHTWQKRAQAILAFISDVERVK